MITMARAPGGKPQATTFGIVHALEDGTIDYMEAIELAKKVDATDQVRLPARTYTETMLRQQGLPTPFDGENGNADNDMTHLDGAMYRGVIDRGQRNALAGIIYGDITRRARAAWKATKADAEKVDAFERTNQKTYADIFGEDNLPRGPIPTAEEEWAEDHTGPYPQAQNK